MMALEHLTVGCVGHLPKAKWRQQYILTNMCTEVCFHEAVPLRTFKS